MDENEVVVSRWDADRDVIANYLKDGARPGEWQVGEWERGFAPEMRGEEEAAALRTIEAYGEECDRNGKITDERRREFWERHTGALKNAEA